MKQYMGHDPAEVASSSSSSSSSSPSGPFPSPGSWADATNITGDTILTQVETTHDASGAVTFTTSRQRFHDATGTGELTNPGGSQPKARVSYVASWHDAAGRQTATANYGTAGGTAPTRPDSAPASSDTILVSTVEYDDRGQSFKTIDPAGSESRQFFDDAGRTTKTIQNYTDGNPSSGGADEDVTVETTYGSDGQVLTLTAKNSTTGDQTTTYVYGTTLTDSDVARADLLRAEIYPDSDDVTDPLGDGVDGVYDRVEYTYNRLGQRTTVKDQNGSVHTYTFDSLGRPTSDAVTTLAAGVDGAVRRITTAYEVRGIVDTITSHDASSDGNVVNQSVFEFNDAGLLSKEYQEHEGAKDASTLYVQYNRDTSSSGGEYTKGLRPTSVRYPNGRLVHTTYGASDSIADATNRLDAIKDDNAGSPGSSLAEYSYLGASTIVKEDFTEPDVRLDYAAGAGDDPYDGFDRFDRVVDQLWYDYGASTDRDRYTYGYDRASNRLYRENTTPSAKDEFYAYDGMSQLATFDRGDLNAGKTAITGTPVREEDWTLDPMGNWTDFVQKTSGSTDLDQDRAQNVVNEITDITETTGTAWITPVHDKNGAKTTVPKPSSLANGLTLRYDAWNRLAEVKDGATTVAVYEYDASNHRVKKHLDSQSPASPDGVDTYIHYFYNDSWQILETRETTAESDEAENVQPKYQHVWSPRYIDFPILRDENTDADSLCDDQRLYYLSDANFNVTTLVDTGGDAVERYLYDPFGKVTIYTGAWSSTRSSSSYDNVHLYTGREYDAETGLYHYRNRYYSAEQGRFISRDPIGFNGGDMNLYRYVSNRPITLLDSSGFSCTCPGGHWTFAGVCCNVSLVIGYSYCRVTARCTKASLQGYLVYNCDNPFKKAFLTRCSAKLSFHIPSTDYRVGFP